MDDNRKKIILGVIGVVFLAAALLATGGYLVNRIVTAVRNLDTEQPLPTSELERKVLQYFGKDESRKYADPMTENILLAMNDDNYRRFSQDFDEQMRIDMNERQYGNTILPIKAKIGKYISKQFVSAENKGIYRVVVYKAKFSQAPGDVTVRSVFRDINGKKYIAGFWLNW
jgi:hypothetical protein